MMTYYNVSGMAWYKENKNELWPKSVFVDYQKIEAKSKAQAASIALIDRLNQYDDYGWYDDEDQPGGPTVTELPVDQQLKLYGAPMLPGFE